MDLVERTQVDMSFKHFLDMAPEEKPVDSNSLITFRRLRLQDVQLLNQLLQKNDEAASKQAVFRKAERSL